MDSHGIYIWDFSTHIEMWLVRLRQEVDNNLGRPVYNQAKLVDRISAQVKTLDDICQKLKREPTRVTNNAHTTAESSKSIDEEWNRVLAKINEIAWNESRHSLGESLS